MDSYQIAAKYLNLIQRAGARHSARDNGLIQQMHDMCCELGAECPKSGTPVHPMLKAAVEALILRHGTHDQKTHGRRHGVGGLREFAKKRGYQVREVKGKDGRPQYAITDKNDKRTKMRASGLSEARKLITSSRKSAKESHTRYKERKEFGASIGDVVMPKDRTGLGINNAFRSKIIGRQGENFLVRPVNARPGTLADNVFAFPKREIVRA